MTKKISGKVPVEIYTTEGGYVAIRQTADVDSADDQVCLLSADQLPPLIRELQSLYEARQAWAETSAE